MNINTINKTVIKIILLTKILIKLNLFINNNIMDVIVLLLLVIGIVFITVSWAKHDLQCPPPQIIYRYVPGTVLDTQFSKENLPNIIYNDMFTSDNIWVGGMSMSSGKTFSQGLKEQKNTGPNTK